MKRVLILGLIGMCGLTGCVSNKKTDRDKKWSILVANAAMERFDSLVVYNNPRRIKWQYDIAILGQTIDQLGNIDKKYSNYYEDFINYFVESDGTIRFYRKDAYNLDNVNPAIGLITLYKRTGEEKYLKAINLIIDQLKDQPRTKAGGFWHKNRYPHQMWLDGIYMACPFMARYAVEFNQPQWFDTITKQITLIYDKTLDPKTGLLYHAWDESKQQKWCNSETGQSKNIWGRGMGWYMMALVDVLDYIPYNYNDRDTLINILKRLSEAVLRVQDKETGLWFQVLDQGSRDGNYVEGSCSAMFTYAFAKGAKNGHLPKNYQEIAENSFNAMVNYFIFEDEDQMPSMKEICGAAGLGGNPYRDGSYEYYITETKEVNDPKGVAPFIMVAIELDR